MADPVIDAVTRLTRQSGTVIKEFRGARVPTVLENQIVIWTDTSVQSTPVVKLLIRSRGSIYSFTGTLV